jgi:hypothetical protein
MFLLVRVLLRAPELTPIRGAGPEVQWAQGHVEAPKLTVIAGRCRYRVMQLLIVSTFVAIKRVGVGLVYLAVTKYNRIPSSHGIDNRLKTFEELDREQRQH